MTPQRPRPLREASDWLLAPEASTLGQMFPDDPGDPLLGVWCPGLTGCLGGLFCLCPPWGFCWWEALAGRRVGGVSVIRVLLALCWATVGQRAPLYHSPWLAAGSELLPSLGLRCRPWLLPRWASEWRQHPRVASPGGQHRLF